jgi:hypothetical protein
MRVGLIVTGGVDRSGRAHIIPALLWLIERLARRHELHVYALRYHREPCVYPLLGARGWSAPPRRGGCGSRAS